MGNMGLVTNSADIAACCFILPQHYPQLPCFLPTKWLLFNLFV
jgi:hypothetical protein